MVTGVLVAVVRVGGVEDSLAVNAIAAGHLLCIRLSVDNHVIL